MEGIERPTFDEMTEVRALINLAAVRQDSSIAMEAVNALSKLMRDGFCSLVLSANRKVVARYGERCVGCNVRVNVGETAWLIAAPGQRKALRCLRCGCGTK